MGHADTPDTPFYKPPLNYSPFEHTLYIGVSGVSACPN